MKKAEGIARAVTLAVALSGLGASVAAQGAKPDNGTDPTRLSRTLFSSYEHFALPGGAEAGTYSLRYTQPISADRRTAVQLRLPFAHASPDPEAGLALGDVGVKLTRVFAVTPAYGIVGEAQLTFDTADRPALGAGTETLKLTGIYALFLKNGAILAPALVHTQGLGSPGPGRTRIRNTVFDLYYVPRLPNPDWYMTLDPAIGYDWETDRASGAFAVTVGRNIPTAGRGTASLFVKPSAGIGKYRAFDAGIEIGVKVVGF